MRRFLFVSLVALGFTTPAQAPRSGGTGAELMIQVRSGTYAVQGRDPGGQAYDTGLPMV